MAQEKLSVTPFIHPTAKVARSTLGRFTEVGERTYFAESTLGDYSYVVNDSNVIYTTIGKFCSIAAMTRLNPGNHPMHRVSQSHFTYRSSAYFENEEDDSAFFEWRRAHPVNIGHDVWIGHGAVILPGRTIGNGAVIAAGAVVTKDVEPYMIVAGTPAKRIKQRFPDKVIEALDRLAWWDWSHDRLHGALQDFRSLSAREFIEKYQNQ
jgi:phosphonate metabolism protein (transferase hexapeptide repeat family)